MGQLLSAVPQRKEFDEKPSSDRATRGHRRRRAPGVRLGTVSINRPPSLGRELHSTDTPGARGRHFRYRSENDATCVGCAAGDHCQGRETGCTCPCPTEDPDPALDTAASWRLRGMRSRLHPRPHRVVVQRCFSGPVRGEAGVELRPQRQEPVQLGVGGVPDRAGHVGVLVPSLRVRRCIGVQRLREREGRSVHGPARRLGPVGFLR